MLMVVGWNGRRQHSLLKVVNIMESFRIQALKQKEEMSNSSHPCVKET